MFGGGPSQSQAYVPPVPDAPQAPPNPPMFGSSAAGNPSQRKPAANQGYAGTILGGISAPPSTGQKTLLGS